MLSRRSLFALSAAAVLTAETAAAQPRPSPVSQLWSSLEFIDREERTFSLAEIQQPLKLIQLWAHWCPACLGEMGSLAALARSLGEQRAQVLLVSNPDDWRRDQLAAQRLRLPFRLATPLTGKRAGADPRRALGQRGRVRRLKLPRFVGGGPMARFVGLDVSQKLTSICVVDETGAALAGCDQP